ncbi:hypothetical protein T4D_14452 [Trichinella pseudospiralis]|uniref:Uncharacterized protein n=1 Tax=Trichinella pseudospiralis TaxID=6337 RepID=A0A0V1FBW4_TRIPS|nr:hypothetical protein T4D_14452 [Trichinella pseudospiralis]
MCRLSVECRRLIRRQEADNWCVSFNIFPHPRRFDRLINHGRLASSEDLCRAVAGINCPQLRELRKSVNNNNTSERDADGIDHFSLSDRFRLNLYGSF